MGTNGEGRVGGVQGACGDGHVPEEKESGGEKREE